VRTGNWAHPSGRNTPDLPVRRGCQSTGGVASRLSCCCRGVYSQPGRFPCRPYSSRSPRSGICAEGPNNSAAWVWVKYVGLRLRRKLLHKKIRRLHRRLMIEIDTLAVGRPLRPATPLPGTSELSLPGAPSTRPSPERPQRFVCFEQPARFETNEMFFPSGEKTGSSLRTLRP